MSTVNDRPLPSGKIHALARIALLAAGLAVLAWLVWDNRHALAPALRQVNALTFALSILLGVAFVVSQGGIFIALVRKYGGETGTTDLLAVYLASQPGKYIPGKVWPAIMQSLALGTHAQLPRLAVVNVELAVIGLFQMVALGLGCLWIDTPPLGGLPLLAGALGVASSAFVLRTPIGLHLARRWPSLAKHFDARLAGNVRSISTASAVMISVASLATNLAASWCVLEAAGSLIPAASQAKVLATLYLGFAASIVAVPVPAGIGVREVATIGLGQRLATAVSGSVLVAITLLARIWQLCVDATGLVLGIVLLVYRARRPR